MAHKVQNLVATNVTSSSVELSWDDVTSLTGELYDIERDGVIVEMSYAGLTFTDTGLDPDTEYTYRVRAVGGTTAGEPNPSVTLTTVAARALMFVPVVSATIPDTSVTLTTVVATASVPTPTLFESDVDPWGIVAARSAITMPGGATVITAGVDDPQTVIDANPAGTTYWFDGTFAVTTRIVPKSGDTLITNNAILDGGAIWTTGDRFTAGSVDSGCDIGLDPRNGSATGTGPVNARLNVTIKGFEIRNFTDNGIRPWLGSEIQYCLVHDCHVNGIGSGLQNVSWEPGGVQTYQCVITDSIVWDCGAVVNNGISGGGMKFARTGTGEDLNTGSVIRASAPDAGMYMTRVYTWRNTGNGLWFDITCGGDLVEDCIADENSRKGFFFQEISAGPGTLQDCTSRNNGTWVGETPRVQSDWGITLVTARGVTIQRNYVHDNGDDNGIKIEQDGRAVTIGHNTDGISVLDNNLRGGDVYFKSGAVTGSVTASGNTDYGAGVYGASYDGTFDPDIIGAPPSFSPDDITGLIGWYDFSLGASALFTDTGMTTPVASDGDTIKGVNDQSSTNHDLTNATGATYKTAIQNGLSVARFNGTTQVLGPASVTEAQPTTIFMVTASSSTSPGPRVVVGSTAGAASTFGKDGTTPPQWILYNGGSLISTGTQVGTTWKLMLAIANTPSSKIYQNGGTAVASGDASGSGWDNWYLGSYNGSSQFWDGDIGEVLIYNSAVSLSDINRVGEYLETKWGITWTTAT